MAARSGLTATEGKVLEIIERRGPLTHADLVQDTGLAPASVSGVLARLEHKGAARRTPHPTDARRALVEVVPEFSLAALERFQGFLAGMTEVAGDYSVEELTMIARFLDAVATLQVREARALRPS